MREIIRDPCRDSLRLVLISDTHGFHRNMRVPDGDILIHAGDFTEMGRSLQQIADFNGWLGELPHPVKLAVPGNHDCFLEEDPGDQAGFLSNATLLVNEGVEIEGVEFWGSPTTSSHGGAFGLSSARDRRALYRKIPEDTDVLITHGPPFGILDSSGDDCLHIGCMELLEAVERVKPRLHVFGHAHEGHGIVCTAETLFVNAAWLDDSGGVGNGPVTVHIPIPSRRGSGRE